MIRPIGDAVGDAVAHCAHLRQLKQSLPQLKTGVWVSDRNRAVFHSSGVADVCIDDTAYEHIHQRHKWDLIIDFLEIFTPEALMQDAFINAPIWVLSKYHQCPFPTHDLNIRFCPPQPQHHIRDYLSHSPLNTLLKTQAYFHLPTPDLASSFDHHWQPQKIRVLLAPIGTFRHIPPHELAALLNGLPSHISQNIDWVMGNSAQAHAYYTALKPLTNAAIRLSPPTDLTAYLAQVCTADLVICVDSGTVHLACAYQRKLLAFYGNCPNNLHMWLPSPHANVPTLVALSAHLAEHSNHTQDFHLPPLIEWLTQQLSKP